MEASRRAFLGGFATVAVPSPAPAASRFMTAKERADYHYAELVKAMNEVTCDYDGWDLHATMRKPVTGRQAVNDKKFTVVMFEVVSHPLMVFERHQRL